MVLVINSNIRHEPVSNPDVLPLQHDSSLLASGILVRSRLQEQEVQKWA